MFAKNSNDNNTFAIIPADQETLQRARQMLGKNELILWICLASHANHRFGGAAWPSPKRLRDLTGISKSQVQLSLARLIETGFIDPTGSKVGKARVFRVLTGRTPSTKSTPVAPTAEIKNGEPTQRPIGQATQGPPMVQDFTPQGPPMVQDFTPPIRTDLKKGTQPQTSQPTEQAKVTPDAPECGSSSLSVADLKIPPDMTMKIQQLPLASIIGKFTKTDAQAVMDELMGQLRVKDLVNPTGYAFRLAQLQREGKLVPSAGLMIQNERLVQEKKAIAKVEEFEAAMASETQSEEVAAAMAAMPRDTLESLRADFLSQVMQDGGLKADLIRKTGGFASLTFKALWQVHFTDKFMGK